MILRPTRPLFAAVLLAGSLAISVSRAATEFAAEPSWQPVTVEAVVERLDEYLAASDIDAERQLAARNAWRETDNAAADVLDRLALSLAPTNDRVAELIEFCKAASKAGKLPEFSWLADSDTPPLIRNNMRLYLARWLTQQGYYDEAVAWTDGLSPEDVVSPEALLFYRAVAHHRLVQPEKADLLLEQLMEREGDLPNRFHKLVDLMQKDLAGLEDESLDHIARRMDDIRRRLAQGRSGTRVQTIENEVIESLDKLIEKAEKQAQQSQSSASSGSQQSGTPMQDSQIAELKAPGKVEPRDIGRRSGWGNLPEKDREKAMQEIGREFPSHYREVIEEYFRRLAAEESAESP